MLDALVREPDEAAGEVVAEEVKPFFDTPNAGLVRMHAQLEPRKGLLQHPYGEAQPPARRGEHQDIVHVAHVVKTTIAERFIEYLEVESPDQWTQREFSFVRRHGATGAVRPIVVIQGFKILAR